ncbi:MAG: C39 family peptidase [Candidatus Shapirobacteria bacterium]
MQQIKLILLFLLLILFSTFILFFIKKPTKEKVETKINQTIAKVEEIKETIAPEPTKILKDGLPNKFLIKTAFVEQAPEKNWDQPWQDACEEASLLTVDLYYKNKSISLVENRDLILDMIKFEDTQTFSKDMNISQMAIVGEKYLNYQTKIIENPSVEDIKKYLSQNIPIIVTANGKTLFAENKHFNSGGPYYHSLVILGYDDTKKQFIVHDVGTKAGAYFHYSYSLLLESIHDFPESGHKEDINNGQKKVLILLK